MGPVKGTGASNKAKMATFDLLMDLAAEVVEQKSEEATSSGYFSEGGEVSFSGRKRPSHSHYHSPGENVDKHMEKSLQHQHEERRRSKKKKKRKDSDRNRERPPVPLTFPFPTEEKKKRRRKEDDSDRNVPPPPVEKKLKKKRKERDNVPDQDHDPSVSPERKRKRDKGQGHTNTNSPLPPMITEATVRLERCDSLTPKKSGSPSAGSSTAGSPPATDTFTTSSLLSTLTKGQPVKVKVSESLKKKAEKPSKNVEKSIFDTPSAPAPSISASGIIPPSKKMTTIRKEDKPAPENANRADKPPKSKKEEKISGKESLDTPPAQPSADSAPSISASGIIPPSKKMTTISKEDKPAKKITTISKEDNHAKAKKEGDKLSENRPPLVTHSAPPSGDTALSISASGIIPPSKKMTTIRKEDKPPKSKKEEGKITENEPSLATPSASADSAPSISASGITPPAKKVIKISKEDNPAKKISRLATITATTTPSDTDTDNPPTPTVIQISREDKPVCLICSSPFNPWCTHYSKSGISIAGIKRRFSEYFQFPTTTTTTTATTTDRETEEFLRQEKYPFCPKCFVFVHDLIRRGEQLDQAQAAFTQAKQLVRTQTEKGIKSKTNNGKYSLLRKVIVGDGDRVSGGGSAVKEKVNNATAATTNSGTGVTATATTTNNATVATAANNATGATATTTNNAAATNVTSSDDSEVKEKVNNAAAAATNNATTCGGSEVKEKVNNANATATNNGTDAGEVNNETATNTTSCGGSEVTVNNAATATNDNDNDATAKVSKHSLVLGKKSSAEEFLEYLESIKAKEQED